MEILWTFLIAGLVGGVVTVIVGLAKGDSKDSNNKENKEKNNSNFFAELARELRLPTHIWIIGLAILSIALVLWLLGIF